MKRYCLALDLFDDENLIAQYDAYHRAVWPEVKQSIRNSGITALEIYRISNRLFMIMEVNEEFSFESKSLREAADEKVQEWELLMWKYQRALPGAHPGEKWMLMDLIFQLD